MIDLSLCLSIHLPEQCALGREYICYINLYCHRQDAYDIAKPHYLPPKGYKDGISLLLYMGHYLVSS